MKYIPLRVKSSYSLLTSLIDIKKMVLFCKEKSIDTICLTDTNMYGVMEFYKECKKNGIKPVIGLELKVDDKLVCTHGWNKKSYNSIGVKYNKKNPIMTYDEFMKTKIHGMFTTMDADRWLYYVEQYPNIIWFCDLKTLSDKDALRTAKALKKLFDGREKLSNQICFQISTKYMYDIIDEYNSFNQYQYFIHKAEYDDFDSLLKWCSDKKIIGMAVNSNVINENVISAIHNYNLKVLCYTIDDVDKAKELLNNGVDCICSNFINPNDMDATEN